MSGAEALREAAALMREQHGPNHERHEMWAAMAALLERADEGWPSYQHTSIGRRTLEVAAAYLGRES